MKSTDDVTKLDNHHAEDNHRLVAGIRPDSLTRTKLSVMNSNARITDAGIINAELTRFSQYAKLQTPLDCL